MSGGTNLKSLFTKAGICKRCYGAKVRFWPIGGDSLVAKPCEWCNGKGTK